MNPKYGMSGVQMTFSEPEDHYGGIKFKNLSSKKSLKKTKKK